MQKDFLQIPLYNFESGLILTIYPEGNAVFREIDILEAQELLFLQKDIYHQAELYPIFTLEH